MRRILPYLLLLLIFTACRKEHTQEDSPVNKPTNLFSGKALRDYFSLLCKISKSTPGFFPPQVARAYGYIGVTNYEAVVNGITGAQSLAGQLNGLSVSDIPKPDANAEYNWSISSNAAVADMIRNMFETKISALNLSTIDSMEKVNLKDMSLSATSDVVLRSIEFGKSIAKAIYKYSTTDGGHKSYLDPFQLPYSMPPEPYCWIPTGMVTTPVSPYWGNNRPFMSANVFNNQDFSPTSYSLNTTSPFYDAALKVYNQVKNNTEEQKEIAKYWADDPFNTCTPAGHTFNIMTQLLEENKATLEKTSVAYAKLAIAENDAFITCWKLKYKHILMRPVTYIRQNIDPSFNTVIGTPPFPAFASGHSVEMGAGSKIFIDMFTDGSGNYNFTDYSQLQYGFAARSFTNFNIMAEECANSRFYGGLHYQMDNEIGLKQGRTVGDNINHLLNFPKNIR